MQIQQRSSYSLYPTYKNKSPAEDDEVRKTLVAGVGYKSLNDQIDVYREVQRENDSDSDSENDSSSEWSI